MAYVMQDIRLAGQNGPFWPWNLIYLFLGFLSLRLSLSLTKSSTPGSEKLSQIKFCQNSPFPAKIYGFDESAFSHQKNIVEKFPTNSTLDLHVCDQDQNLTCKLRMRLAHHKN